MGPILAYFRVFWGPTTIENPSEELKFSEFVLLWKQEQIRAFVTNFWAVCNFSQEGDDLLSFGAKMGLF